MIRNLLLLIPLFLLVHVVSGETLSVESSVTIRFESEDREVLILSSKKDRKIIVKYRAFDDEKDVYDEIYVSDREAFDGFSSLVANISSVTEDDPGKYIGPYHIKLSVLRSDGDYVDSYSLVWGEHNNLFTVDLMGLDRIISDYFWLFRSYKNKPDADSVYGIQINFPAISILNFFKSNLDKDFKRILTDRLYAYHVYFEKSFQGDDDAAVK